jgi:type I restriction enzyme, S subunit
MTWTTCRIGDLIATGEAAIQTGPFGTQLKASDYTSEGTPLINVRNIGYGDIRTRALEFIPDRVKTHLSQHILAEGDIVFGRKGAVDRHAIVRADQAGWVQGSDCIRLRLVTDRIRPDFLSFALLSDSHRQWMLTQASNKATMASLNHDVISRIQFPLPATSIQDKIIQVLNSYGELIENNRRRIRLLEETARLLYHEWFVYLRFPGHEHLQLINGLPERWNRQALELLCMDKEGIQTGPFGSQLHQSDYSEAGVPVVMPKNLISFRIAPEEIARIPDALAHKLSPHCMAEGDTVYGRRGDIGRRAFISAKQAGWLCGTGCLRIRPDPEKVSPRFLFDALGAPDTAGAIANRAKGATMLNLNATLLKSVPVLVPPPPLQDLYVEQVQPMYELIELLSEQNTKLKIARDLLLPQLMSGKVEV